MTLEWKVRSYRSENGRKIMSEDRRSLENKDFLQISQLVLHSKKKDICFQQMSFFCVQTPGAGRAALLNRPAGIARFQRVFRFSSPFRGGRSLPQPGSSPRRKPISSRRRAMNRPSISDSVSPARRITPISMVKLGMGTEWIPIWSFRSGGRATPTL